MFKKLRNKLLITNTLIIAALIMGSFSIIYFMTAQNTKRDIDQKLERAITEQMSGRNIKRGAKQTQNERERIEPPQTDNDGIQRDMGEAPPEEPNGEAPPEEPNGEAPPEEVKEPDNGASREMSVENLPDNVLPEPVSDNDEKKPFSLTFTVIADKDGTIRSENIPFSLDEDFYTDKIPELIDKREGHIKSESGNWKFRIGQTDGSYIIAFTECTAERSVMRNLILILSLVGLIALAAVLLIGFIIANSSIKPIEDSYNKQKQFVADASHELKTPLTTINTNVDVLLSHTDNKIAEEKKWLDYIKTEAERMTKLTNDLLYLAGLDHGGGNVIYSPVSFSEATESVILLMEAVIFEKNVNMDYSIEPDISVKASPEQLKQLVMILLDNAVKYTPASGSIRVTLAHEGADAALRVRNTGEGISEEAQKQIFERFYREDRSRSRESGGYGLGLAIAKAIVNEYKGSIKVFSKKNEFTEFTVKIPAVK